MTGSSDRAETGRSLATETPNHASAALDEMSTADAVATMNDADFAVPEAIRQARGQIAAAISAAEAGFVRGGRLIYVGAGTSGRLGVLDAAECPPTFHTEPDRVVGLIAGGPAALMEAVEGAEDDTQAGATDIAALEPGPGDAVIGIAASGRTPYVIGALRHARTAGAVTISLSCNLGAELSGIAEHAIELDTGPEVLTGSTRLKAGSAQKQVLNMFSTILMVRAGRTYANLMVDLHPTNAKLRLRAVRLVELIGEVDEPAATHALAQCAWEVKTAVVMLRCRLDPDAARRRLAEVSGSLAEAIDLPSSQHPGLH
jgi:N-acetylmuramic acid 6-phosphate etherase